MQKSTRKPRGKGRDDGDLVKILALRYGLTPGQIRRIRSGDSRNEDVFTDYMTLKEEKSNLLLKAVNELVPF